MAGIVHDNGAGLALCVLNLDNPNLRVHWSEGDSFGILRRVMIVRKPGFPGMAVLTHDQAVEPQLGKTSMPRGDPCGEHVLNGGVQSFDDLFFVKSRILFARVRMS